MRSSAALIYEQRLIDAVAETRRARALATAVARRAETALADLDADADLRLAAIHAGVLTE
jgi:hypothetical protein